MHVIESQFLANIFLRGKIECLASLHIGDSQMYFKSVASIIRLSTIL